MAAGINPGDGSHGLQWSGGTVPFVVTGTTAKSSFDTFDFELPEGIWIARNLNVAVKFINGTQGIGMINPGAPNEKVETFTY